MGAWDTSHYREHIQFVQVLAAEATPIIMDNYDLSALLTAGSARSSVLQSHSDAHNLLRQIAGVTGVDYTEFNLDQERDFYDFLGYHATEHAQIRQALGIV